MPEVFAYCSMPGCQTKATSNDRLWCQRHDPQGPPAGSYRRSQRLRIEYNGTDWMATFHEVITEALSSLLEGGPLEMTLLLGNDDNNTRWFGCTVVGIDPDFIFTADGQKIDRWNDLLGIEA